MWMGTAAVAAVWLLGAPFAMADTLYVPGDYPTIQKAVDAALDGDQVVVAPGAYYEKINLLGKAITVRSSDGPEVTTIDNQGAGTVVKCVSGEGPETVLDGFTITGGSGTFNGGGMENYASAPTVANCIFTGNSAERGGGMCNTYASPTVIDCAFLDNAADDGGGLCNYYSCYPTVIGCTFEGNDAVYRGGGLNASHDCVVTLVDCTFLDNSALECGGGIYSLDSDPVLSDCLFELNAAATTAELGGGGGIAAELGDPELHGCVFLANTTPAWGGAFKFENSAPAMVDCAFLGNDANKGGALSYSYAAPVMVNCLFVGNTATSWAAAISSHRSAPSILNCTIAANAAPDTGGLRIKQDPVEGATVVANCVLWANEDDTGDDQHAQLSLLWADPELVNVDYSCVQGWADLVEGEGNIAVDPQFVGPNEGDYRLSDASPCIDAANNLALPDEIELDLDGNPRLVDNPNVVDTGVMQFGDPGVVDMGAYEWQFPTCFGDLNQDGMVDVVDLLILLATWGECPDPGHCFGDLDGSGEVDVIDLLLLLAVWGPCA